MFIACLRWLSNIYGVYTHVGEWLCACVRVYVLGSVGVHALRINSLDKILCR